MPDEQDLMTQAMQQYPYLRDKGILYQFSPGSNKSYGMESFGPGETGDSSTPRPKSFPIDKFGIEVYDPKSRPIDILGDYVSHFAVQNDPKLKKLYEQFSTSLNPRMMQQKYQYDIANFGETRPFEVWAKASGIPSMFRGYTFDQWEKPEEIYTPDQLQILDKVRDYLGIKKQ